MMICWYHFIIRIIISLDIYSIYVIVPVLCKCYFFTMKRLTTKEFIEKARKVHGDKYNYSKVEYKDSHTKVSIICPIHGEFSQTPNNHLNGQQCPFCSSQSASQPKSSNEYFVKMDYIDLNYKCPDQSLQKR